MMERRMTRTVVVRNEVRVRVAPRSEQPCCGPTAPVLGEGGTVVGKR